MAKHVIYNASVVMNGVDLSDHVESVSYTVGLNKQAAAAMGDVQDYSMPGTAKEPVLSIRMYQDFAASKVYATLMALYTNRSTFLTVVKVDSGADAATNPAMNVTGFIETFPVFNGARGDRHMTDIVIAPSAVATIDIT